MKIKCEQNVNGAGGFLKIPRPRSHFCLHLFALCLCFLHFHSAHFERQAEQVDESVGVMVVVEITGGEACQGFTVE